MVMARQQPQYKLKTMLETVIFIMSVTRVLSSKCRLHFKTHRSHETKIWSWVPRGPETKNNCAGENQQKFTGLDWS
jgi:hypothetical protein